MSSSNRSVRHSSTVRTPSAFSRTETVRSNLAVLPGYLERGDLEAVEARWRRLSAVHEHHLEQRGEAGRRAGRSDSSNASKGSSSLPRASRAAVRTRSSSVSNDGLSSSRARMATVFSSSPTSFCASEPLSVGRGRAHHDVALPRPARQQHLHSGEHDHVRGDAHPGRAPSAPSVDTSSGNDRVDPALDGTVGRGPRVGSSRTAGASASWARQCSRWAAASAPLSQSCCHAAWSR